MHAEANDANRMNRWKRQPRNKNKTKPNKQANKHPLKLKQKLKQTQNYYRNTNVSKFYTINQDEKKTFRSLHKVTKKELKPVWYPHC